MDRTDSKTGVDILSDKMSNFITGENTSTLPVTPKNNLQAGIVVNIQTMIGEQEYAEQMGDKIIDSLKQNMLITTS